MAQENNNSEKKRKVSQYWLIGVLVVIILLVGFSTLIGSSFTREEIRSTAYVLAAIKLTQDAEVIVLPTAAITISPSEPAWTPELLDCPAEELSAWIEITTADIAIIEAEIEVLKSNDFTADELIDIQARVLAQESTLLTVNYPECAALAQESLQNVYSQFALTLQAVIDNDITASESQGEIFVSELVEFLSLFVNVIERYGNQ
ncbi:MAG: hypothetical protein FVQ83_03380 [Chloroflexi bacterium]|nr:hypothetical protein [Chloroflexota bacterium]